MLERLEILTRKVPYESAAKNTVRSLISKMTEVKCCRKNNELNCCQNTVMTLLSKNDTKVRVKKQSYEKATQNNFWKSATAKRAHLNACETIAKQTGSRKHRQSLKSKKVDIDEFLRVPKKCCPKHR